MVKPSKTQQISFGGTQLIHTHRGHGTMSSSIAILATVQSTAEYMLNKDREAPLQAD